MGILDRVKKLCSDRGISVGDLEKELELSNGSIYKWNKTTPGADKVEKVADYFSVSTDYLLGRTEIRNQVDKIKEINKLANKEIYSVEDALEIIESQEGLMLKGEMLTDEDKLLLANALQLGMKYVLDKKQKEQK